MLNWIMMKSRKGPSPKKAISLYVLVPRVQMEFGSEGQLVSVLQGRVLGVFRDSQSEHDQSSSMLFSLLAAASLLHQATWPNPQRNRRSSSLTTGSVAESFLPDCPLHYRPAQLLPALSAIMVDPSSSLCLPVV